MVERDVTIYSGFDSFIIDSIFKDNYPFYSMFYSVHQIINPMNLFV